MRPSRLVQRPRFVTPVLVTTALVTTVSALAATALVGCQPAPKPAPPRPAPMMATPEQANTTQRQFAAFDPHARVGHVDTVSTADHTAVVAGIPLADVKVGDPISFTGPDHQPVANGTITELDDHSSGSFAFLIVDYQKAGGGTGRDPIQGDLAITLPLGK